MSVIQAMTVTYHLVWENNYVNWEHSKWGDQKKKSLWLNVFQFISIEKFQLKIREKKIESSNLEDRQCLGESEHNSAEKSLGDYWFSSSEFMHVLSSHKPQLANSRKKRVGWRRGSTFLPSTVICCGIFQDEFWKHQSMAGFAIGIKKSTVIWHFSIKFKLWMLPAM